MRHVIIGASAAGVNAAGLLRQYDPDSEITVVAKDDRVYSRCMLHLKIAGTRDDAGLAFVDADFFAANRVAWRGGETVADILVDDKAAALESGGKIPYDRLLIASGAQSFIPPVPGLREAKNVVSLRNMDDVEKLTGWGRPGTRAVVIGAGLVGMDAAVALIENGVKVTLVEMMDRVLAIQLDDYAASRYADLLRVHGVEVIVGAKVQAGRSGDAGRLRSLELADGRELPCDFCVVAAGVAPNIGFIKDGRIALTQNKRAVAVDRRCRTSCPDVFAAGDVTFLAPIWPEAVRQAEVAAANMAGREASLPDQDWAWTNSMNFFGLPTVSYGHTSMADPSFIQETYIDGDVYRKVIHKDGVIHGAVFQGDIDNCGVYLRLVRDRIPFGHTGKNPLDLNYADFFQQAANGEFV
ncbi:MAG: FAD-dependent oxidoreductase [Planctomycetota bacterium]|jgi:NAD(P)H-nitrite reductase large subunit|nr:FAD-dependent oxidoreductase [Planctomycetota bacterium]